MDEAVKAAEELNLQLSEEGNVLLKNDGTLPLDGGERVSIFGVKQDNLLGAASGSAFAGAESTSDGSVSIAKSLEKAGFKVNPTLVNFYAADNSGIGNENLNFTGEAEASMEMYNDLAVIVLTREGGEGSDASTVTSETVGEDDDHKALYTDANGNTYRHSLMLTKSEENLFAYVKARFDKIVVLLNTSNAMEMGDLQNDPAISAILWMGRPGKTGTDAVGNILNGSVNPSGRLVDVWPADFTADPTWYNFGNNKQTGTSTMMVTTSGTSATGASDDKSGYFSVDYEEGIYLGYKYYETYYWEKYSKSSSAGQSWYEDNVVYPFGYGLSYTTFSMNISGGLYTNASLTKKLGSTVSASSFNTDADHPDADIETLYLPVTVKNTGSVAGKQVVQVYVTAPYKKGGIEKSSVVLVGYAKTSLLKPGESETVVVSFNVQDMASWDYNDANKDGVKGDYELDAGTYTIRVMESSHYDRSVKVSDKTDGYDEVSFTLSGTAHQKTDDFSGNEVGNLFSEENGVFLDNAATHAMYYNSIRTEDLMADGESHMTLLSRADFDGTFPKAPVKIETDGVYSGDLVFKQEAYDNWLYYDSFNVSEGDADRIDDAWVQRFIELGGVPENWTQGADAGIKFADMAGIPLDDERWVTFMNQLSWEELVSIIEMGGYSTVNVDSVDKDKTVDADGPNNFSSSYNWCCECTISSTWNVVLAEKQGRIMGCFGMFMGITGWYAPGMDTHRSPFSGRNNEYYSQDGIQGGYIAAAVVKGAQSKGLICYVKHIALNDQETNRDGKVLFVWADEQNIRENYTKVFQMAMQEGGSSAAMAGYARLGGIPNASNYNFMYGLMKDEWGWEGYMVTDGYIGWRDATELDMMVRAGCELQLYTSPYVETVSGTWDATARDGKGSVSITVPEGTTPEAGYENPDAASTYISNIQYYFVRDCATRVMYKNANSTNHKNGYGALEYASATLTAEQHVSFNGSVALNAAAMQGSTAVYEITAGELPAGITLNASSGQLSGTATVAGDYSFTVQATIDTYITKTANYTLSVKSAFGIADGSDPLDSAKVGKDFYVAVTSSVFATSANGGTYETVVYTASGLPAGLTMSEDGIISGTPLEAGSFKVIVSLTATKAKADNGGDSCGGGESGGGESGGGESTPSEQTVEYTLVLTVAEGDKAPENNDPAPTDPAPTTPATTEPAPSDPVDEPKGGNGLAVVALVLSVVAVAASGAVLVMKKKEAK